MEGLGGVKNSFTDRRIRAESWNFARPRFARIIRSAGVINGGGGAFHGASGAAAPIANGHVGVRVTGAGYVGGGGRSWSAVCGGIEFGAAEFVSRSVKLFFFFFVRWYLGPRG